MLIFKTFLFHECSSQNVFQLSISFSPPVEMLICPPFPTLRRGRDSQASLTYKYVISLRHVKRKVSELPRILECLCSFLFLPALYLFLLSSFYFLIILLSHFNIVDFPQMPGVLGYPFMFMSESLES